MFTSTRQLHFISGLPRAGSTLLSALLRQNPRVHAGMSSPVAGLLSELLAAMSGRNEFSVFISDEQRQRILRGVVENYYAADFTSQVIFDTNRTWCARMSVLQTLFPESRVIACVREVPWIVDSIEQLVQRNAFSPSSIFNFQPGGSVYSRADSVANGDGMLGGPYNALKQAFYGDQADRLMLVRYETLVSDPQRVLQAIYDFTGQPAFTHNFEQISFDAEEFDRRAGTPGLHHIRPKVAATLRRSILPPDVFRRFENDAFWQNPQLNPNGVTVI
jgi:sulfotransferase